MKIKSNRTIFLNKAMPEDGIQRFFLGIEDSDGPFAFITTKLSPGYFIGAVWFQQLHADQPGMKLIMVLQSYSHGMRYFNWTLPLHGTLLDEMYVSLTSNLNNPFPEDLDGTIHDLVIKECQTAEYETILRFDGDITPRFALEWWDPCDGNRYHQMGVLCGCNKTK